MNIVIREEKVNDYFYVEAVIRASFWNVYKPGCDEHVMAHKLRNSKEYIRELDLVADDNGKIVGNVICSKAKITNKQNEIVDDENVLFVGPICALPEYQKQGIGSMLMEQVKSKARAAGYKGLVLYGNPAYYHRFGFVNAKEYGITMPNGTNMDEFMALELNVHSLDTVHGRCYESTAFEVSKDELAEYESKFTGKLLGQEENCERLDYTKIKQVFTEAKIAFPLKEEECIGLSWKEQMEINPCGTYCGKCEDYGVVCDGCRNRQGKPIWYDLYSKKEPCEHYTCCIQEHHCHNCSQCPKVPCSMYFQYPDPNMSDEIKQMWFQLRMNNFNEINCLKKVSILDTFEKNVKLYSKFSCVDTHHHG